MGRKIISMFTSLLLLFGAVHTSPLRAFCDIPVSAKSAILMEQTTGQILYEKDSKTRRPMASTTKIMTAICAIEAGDLEREITVTKESVGIEGSAIYLKEGDKITLEELIWAVMLESANDAAETVAVSIGGSTEGFAEIMNRKAKELSLDGTHFVNPHGLSDDDHYTTAEDLARLTAYAMKNEKFRQIVSTDYHKIDYGESVRNLRNHNKLLRLYDGAVGVKTGFTKRSGRCLVSAAERDGLTLIAVTLDAPDDWDDHTRMLDAGFSAIVNKRLISASEAAYILPCIGGDGRSVLVQNSGELSVILPRDDQDVVTKVILPHYLYAPIEEGQSLGKLQFFLGDTLLGEVPLVAMETVERVRYKQGLFERIFN